ncbi:hypothetical protein SBF1_400002 [Candidatus Desulfosporosinus infrequens]|uniref:Uncharacterized protein n=1 Tax=Candidatus Desulfosporosinus infrequens TaxID=2043169 RepID=A0A2U3L8B1_9FIRM|nr:hypothetical protein SBF1_400002 [Candidatus Desulfosporosinus infrequens]
MKKPTIADLQDQLIGSQKLNELQLKTFMRLQTELAETHSGQAVVSRVEMDGVLSQLEDIQNRYKVLEQLYEKERKRPSVQADVLALKGRIAELEQENEQLL